MTKVKRFSLILLSTLIFVCAAFVFAGCGDKNKNCKIYVFSTVGGHVKVDDNKQIVKFGDEGSKIFTYKQKDKISLKAVADKGYDFVKWQFSDGFDTKYADNINQPQLDIVVDVDELVIKAVFDLDGSIESHKVNYPTDTTGYTIAPLSGYTSTVLDGANFKFKVRLWSDYSNSSIVVKSNDEVLTADNEGVYTILNINEDISITVEGVTLNPAEEVETYTVSTNDTRFTIIPVGQNSCKVEEGNSFTFEIQLKSGFKFDTNVVVKANGKTLAESNKQYTIDSVTEDVEIVVTGIIEDVENQDPIILGVFTQDARFTIVPISQNNCEVEFGNDFTFKIDLKEGYKFDTSVVVKANGQNLTQNNNEYTINYVTENIEIVVIGIIEDIPEVIEPTIYTISTTDTRFDIIPVGQDNLEVEAGKSFVFTVQVKDGYKIDSMLVVKANDNLLIVNSGKYTIEVVTQDIVITVDGIVEDKQEEIETNYYLVSTNDTRFIIVPVSQADCNVKENESFTFKIELNDGYKFDTNVVVKANSIVLNNIDDKYTIQSVIGATEITVDGIIEDKPVQEEPTIYTVSTTNTLFVIESNGVIKDSHNVESESKFEFTIKLTNPDKYEFADNIVVTAGGVELTLKNGVYTISSVISDIVITVEGIIEKTPEVVYETYEFALDFNEGIKNVYTDLVDSVPSIIKIVVAENDKQSQYNTSQFIVKDEDENEISIKEIIDSVEDIAPQVTQFTISGMAFIVVSGDNITINWDVLNIADLTESLIIELAIN